MKEQNGQKYSGMKINEAQGTVRSDLSMVAVGDKPVKAFSINKDENVGL